MRRSFCFRIVVALWVLCCSAVVFSGTTKMLLKEQIDRTQWPEQRNSGSVLALTQINAILSQFDEVQAHRITIRYPGGDLGNAWALEVRDWLVALGMPSDAVILEPGSGGSDQLILLLEKLSGS